VPAAGIHSIRRAGEVVRQLEIERRQRRIAADANRCWAEAQCVNERRVDGR
jgi:hypothetical protein